MAILDNFEYDKAKMQSERLKRLVTLKSIIDAKEKERLQK